METKKITTTAEKIACFVADHMITISCELGYWPTAEIIDQLKANLIRDILEDTLKSAIKDFEITQLICVANADLKKMEDEEKKAYWETIMKIYKIK